MDAASHKRFVGDNLRLAIEAQGLSQAAVARALGISAPKLGNWLRGANYPDEWVMVAFCDRYGVTMDWIYRRRLFGLPGEMQANLAAAAEALSAAP